MIDVPIQVKDALREGRLRKNYRFQVLNDNGTVDFTIDNDNLVSESVNIDERMCSGDKIEYGLCEGSSLELQYFGKENITGRQLKVFVDVEYGESTPYAIPMGYFTVKNCSRQASTGIIKAVCYNKLQSDYLDAKANKLLLETFDGDETTQLTLFDIQRDLLSDYGIIEREKIALTMVEVPYTPTTIYSLPIKFSSLYNIDSPLSAANFQSKTSYAPSLNVEYSLCLFTAGADIYTETSYYWDIKFLKGKIDWFAHVYALQAATLIANAQLLHNDSLVTYEDAYNWIVSTLSFYILYNNTVYNLLTDGDSKLREIDKLVHHNEAVEIRIVIPRGIGITFNNAGRPFEFVKWQETNNYVYWQKEGDFDPITVQGEYPPLITFSYGYGRFDTSVDISDMFAVNAYDLSDAEMIQFTISDIPEFTLRDIVGANYETQCQFGQLDRVTDLFSGVELNHSRLLPQDTLYPSDSLYPYGSGESAFKSQYSKLWADEGNIHKWRYLIITYKGLDGDGNEADFTLQRTINNDGTDDYNCSDNWLFRNLVWTEAQISEYANAMKAKMQDITWFPFEMWCAGLPYLETGDEIEIPLGNQTYTSYILQRQLKGIQNLQDTYINGTLDIF